MMPPMTAKLSAEELEKLEALAKAATPGKWTRHKLSINVVTIPNGHITIQHDTHPGDEMDVDVTAALKADGDFIAATDPSVVLRLTAQVREAEARWEALKVNSEGMNQYYRETLKDEMAQLESEQ